MCRKEAGDRPIEFRQTNSEAQMIDWIHEAIDGGAAGIVINPAAWTFTSIAVLDALKMFAGPIIEHPHSLGQRTAAVGDRSRADDVIVVAIVGGTGLVRRIHQVIGCDGANHQPHRHRHQAS